MKKYRATYEMYERKPYGDSSDTLARYVVEFEATEYYSWECAEDLNPVSKQSFIHWRIHELEEIDNEQTTED